VREAALNNTAG